MKAAEKQEVKETPFVRLASINVNDRIEKKNGLSYLSWAWALDQLMRADPEAIWEYLEPKTYGQTMMVFCTVHAFGKSRTAFLPVMDHRNKPIPNPDAFQVNTAMQRCFVKAIALHGLGLYIYAGEDLPPDENGQLAEQVDSEAMAETAKKNLDAAAKQGMKALQAAWADLPAPLKVALKEMKETLKHAAADVDADK